MASSANSHCEGYKHRKDGELRIFYIQCTSQTLRISFKSLQWIGRSSKTLPLWLLSDPPLCSAPCSPWSTHICLIVAVIQTTPVPISESFSYLEHSIPVTGTRRSSYILNINSKAVSSKKLFLTNPIKLSSSISLYHITLFYPHHSLICTWNYLICLSVYCLSPSIKGWKSILLSIVFSISYKNTWHVEGTP